LPLLFWRPPKLAEGAPAQRARANRSTRLSIVCLLLLLLYLALSYRRVVPGRIFSSDQPYFPDVPGSGIPVGYSAALEAMDEPSLWKISQRGRDAVYRFLRVPSSIGRPLAVRITRTGDGAELLMIELDGELTSQTSNRARTERKVLLSLAQWSDVDSLAERAGFWELPTPDNRVISDGTALIVEAVRGGLYHVVHRQSPPPGPYRSLCRYLLALSGPGHPLLMGEHETLSVGLGCFVLVKSRKLALAVRFLEHTPVGHSGSDYNGATYEWFLQADGSGDFTRDNLASGKGEVRGDQKQRWDEVVIACGPVALQWSQCYTDSDYVGVHRTDCKIDRFDVIAIAASDWSERSKIQLDNKYLNWSIAD
jgi:hypothetical protein